MFFFGTQSLFGLLLISGVHSLGPQIPIPLGTAGNFTVFAQTGVSTVPQSVITGNVGVSPAASGALTGFSMTLSATGTSASSTQVVKGSLFAASFTSPTPAQLTKVALDMRSAFANGNLRLLPDSLNLLAGLLTAQTLSPGLYKWTSGVTVTTSLTLKGGPTDVWIFQVQNNLLFSSGTKMVLTGGALSKNVFWVVSGTVTLNAAALLDGIILGATNVALVSGASVNGRILAQTAVTLQQSAINPA